MKRFYIWFVFFLCVTTAYSAKYTYSFNQMNLADALTAIAEKHPEIQLNFIYNEIDNYKTSASINTDNAYQALRQTIGLNPVSIIYKDNHYYIEALQHGKFQFYGNLIGEDDEPIVGASLTILAPRDSTVITYGTTDSNGRFNIPCDKKIVLVKIACVGYKTVFVDMPDFSMGTLKVQQSPILLANVSVEADNTLLSTDKNIYIPTSRQKKASHDATDLLRRMAIPQLVINPADNSVKDVFGNSVPVYINCHEAEPDELKGMRMTDVRRIEFFEFPADPRFKGEQRVVNFIVQEYEYGGYTKVSESLRTLNGIFNNTDIFSRFTYKKMTYDIYAGCDNQNYHHAGADNSALYMLENDGKQMPVNRKETFGESDTHVNKYPVTIRATYTAPRFTARNMLAFTHNSSPGQNTSGDLKVDLRPDNNYTYARNNSSKNNTVYYHSNIGGLFGSNGSYEITPSFKHTHRNNISSYESTLMQVPIYNIITENTYNWGIQASGRMAFGKKSQLTLFLAGSRNINKLSYKGTNSIDDSYLNSYISGNLTYRYRTQKYTFSSFIGYGFNRNSMNGISTHDAFPKVGINAIISLDKKSQISAFLNYQTSTPYIGMKANDIIQSNEYMYLTANPNLKNWRTITSNLAYNRFYNNSVSMAAFAGYDQYFNRVATIYRPFDDGKALLRDFINDGTFKRYYLGIQVNYKLFNNSLQLYANLTQNAYEITGTYKESYYPFRFQLQGVYYWKSFNILASWANPECSLTENSNYIIRRRNFHMLSIGWGDGTWNIKLAANNIFNKGWRSETWEKQTPLYSEYQQFYNPSAHPNFNLSVTYTVGYGKKVQYGNEVRGQDSAPSAIIR